MNWAESTHKQKWLFTSARLEAIRTANLKQSADGSTEAQPSPEKDAGWLPVSPTEELQLLQFFATNMQALVKELQLPSKVAMSALVLLRRFYLSKSVLDADPAKFNLTAIYVACKAEESYFSAEDFCRAVKKESSVVLQTEVAFLQGLDFDLVVHSPLWALRGMLEHLDTWRLDDSERVPQHLKALSRSGMERGAQAAKAALSSLALTDAVLLLAPGSLALASMRIGYDQMNVALDAFVKHMEEAAAASCSVSEVVMKHSFDMAQKLYQESLQLVTTAQVLDIDKKIKVFKKRRQKKSIQASETQKPEF